LSFEGDFDMASRKFRFVSPGVFLKEIDQSQLPRTPEGVGPILIGRTRKGPSMKPYKVRSFQEFERVFGLPMPGNEGEDPWREGTHLLAESYLPYAAQAYLSADIDSPVTVVRLAGVSGDDALEAGEPGWEATNAYGMFLVSLEDTSALIQTASLELGAIWYGTDSTFNVQLEGVPASSSVTAGNTTIASGSIIKADDKGKFSIKLTSGAGTRNVKFALNNIRNEFNTNPVTTNSRISRQVSGTLAHHYWLGETFNETYQKLLADTGDTKALKLGAVILKLADGMDDFKSTSHGLTAARTGWVFGNDTNATHAEFNPDNQQKLFRLLALHEGTEASKDLMIAIEDLRVPDVGALDRFGKFSVVVKKIMPAGFIDLERFDECNLDPNSQNHIARRIGDVYYEWDPVEKRNKTYGGNVNISEYIRVEMDPSLNNSPPTNTELVPFGFFGPIVPKTIISKPEQYTLTFAGQPTSDKTITIVSADGTSRTYTGKNAASFASNEFNRDTSATAAANSLAAAINHENGHKHKLTASVAAEVVTVTNKFAGATRATANISNQLNNVTVVTSSTAKGSDLWVECGSLAISGAVGSSMFGGGEAHIKWPTLPLVNTASYDDPRFGMTSYTQDWTNLTQSIETDQTNKGHIDYIRAMPNLSSNTLLTDQLSGLATGGNTEVSLKFTLDDVILAKISSVSTNAEVTGRGQIKTFLYKSGSRQAGDSWSSKCNTEEGVELNTMLELVSGFHMPLVGGNDGIDITEANPFNNSTETLQGKTTANSYAYASVDRAIELIRDAEVVEHNLAVLPGITEEKLTKKLVRTCEARGDSLAIIDLPFVYQPPSEKQCDSYKDRVSDSRGRVKAAAKRLVGRQLNSSYGATYYPWVQIKDDFAGKDVWVPPSVVALGVMAYTEEKADVWFAPAGFNRGGLDTGNAGLTVLRASEQLLSKERDTLYGANINPIAQFVSEGLVVFGQKTLQQTQSALDRINVRRLLIFVKKEISRISKDVLFEQNVQVTWNRFKVRATKFLDEVKVRFGLSDFKVVLDETTTTADLVDRNILYAKVFLKPARSIEFIAVDFVITRSGAAYDD